MIKRKVMHPCIIPSDINVYTVMLISPGQGFVGNGMTYPLILKGLVLVMNLPT
mgnify:CR=1 FL=1